MLTLYCTILRSDLTTHITSTTRYTATTTESSTYVLMMTAAVYFGLGGHTELRYTGVP